MAKGKSMAGKVKAYPQAGTPTQQYVDASLQFLEDTKATIEEIDVKNLTKEALGKVVQTISGKTEQVAQKQQKESQNQILKTAKKVSQKFSQMFELIQPIISMDLSLENIVKWAKKVVKFFAKYYLWYFLPYQKLILLIMFATQYQIVFTKECAEILNALQQKISQLKSIDIKNLLGQAQSKQLQKAQEKVQKAQEQNQLLMLTLKELQEMRGKLKRDQETANKVLQMFNEQEK